MKPLINKSKIGVVSLLGGVGMTPRQESGLVRRIVSETGVTMFQVLLGDTDHELRRGLLEKAGVTKIGAVGMWPTNAPDPWNGGGEVKINAAVRQLLGTAEMAVKLGAVAMGGPFTSPWLAKARRSKVHRTRALRFLRAALRGYARRGPIDLVVEPINRFENDLVSGLADVRAIALPGPGEVNPGGAGKLMVLLDIAHAAMENWDFNDLEDTLQLLKTAGVGVVVHLSAPSRGRVVGFNTTTVMFPAFLQLILRYFPDAEVYLEAFPSSCPVLNELARQVRDSLEVSPVQYVAETVAWLMKLDGDIDYASWLKNPA